MKTRSVAGLAVLVLVVPVVVLAAAGTDQIARKGEAFEARAGWPEGVGALVNDPARTRGWAPWFSGLPNDANYFEMEAAGPKDVERVVGLLAAVKAPVKRIQIDLGADPRFHFGPPPANREPAVAVLFTIGHQPTLDAWYDRLPEPIAGVKRFGVHDYKERPTAVPPTLTLYVRHKAIDLTKLRVPAGVEVVPPKQWGREPLMDPLLRTVDDFLKAHKARP